MLKKNNQIPNSYISLFSLNYFNQGCSQSMIVFVIPFYLLITESVINAVALSFMMSFVLIPFTFKFLFGILSDKLGTKRFGRRKLWIVIPSAMAGIVWIGLTTFLEFAGDLILLFSITGIIISLGIALTDTGIDGFILDNCPPAQLGRVNGITWALRGLGILVGASGGLLILSMLDIKVLFVLLGIMSLLFSFPAILMKETEENRLLRAKILLNIKTILKERENWKVFNFSLFFSIVAGVINVLLALYILLRTGLVTPVEAKIEILTENSTLYWIQAIIIFFINIGIFFGSVIGGRFADKVSRKKATYLAFAQTTISMILLLILGDSKSWFLLLFLTVIIGWATGWNASALLSIISQYSKQYPEATATYQTITLSFNNLGALIGLTITGLLLNSVFKITSDVFLTYSIIFVLLVLLYLLGLIPFLSMDNAKYEHKPIKI